ncbi:MAG: hypothetical protein FJ214_07240 [Ignavibacteria bacterium]|nr:hypothetical protein [Ignavibacteria bacterium]
MKNQKEIETIDISRVSIDNTWSFSDKTVKDTSYATHGYYTYPAKFIPQLASRLIIEYSNENEIVVDPFMGSGTTIVEAIINNRRGVGLDINNIANLIGKVKTTPIDNIILSEVFTLLAFDLETRLNGNYSKYLKQAIEELQLNKRIDYWFRKNEKEQLLIILQRIKQIEHNDIRDFFLLAFAQILKSCSIWLQKSVKPTRDFSKEISEPLKLFLKQSQKMIKKHGEFNDLLADETKRNINKYRTIKLEDSRKIPCKNNEVTLIVTSPPYVTSYEYADLHQLPSLWFGYLDELSEFRKKFIGSAYKERESIDLKSSLAEEIFSLLGNNKKGREVINYFADMLESFNEMKRVLKKGGKACIVIGNTQFKGVKILNAEVFQEQFENIGFRTFNIIHREIPSKMLPSTRDISSGQFVKSTKSELKLAYPTEYILIMEKL